ncbi:MAG: MarR family transcriptional regulator [SAR86 cluster bacterium]|uniref:MarR family transcriptional regulator n=1 Tax=SAR86 cluster bacterium TaxID=2030880 RepID=A0A2A5AUK6_9GAMM|nr:MAG: MarR family transcriptional regulator [SAR86 cluster bacterium]
MSKIEENKTSESDMFVLFNEISIISQLSVALFERTLPDGLTNSQFGVLNWFMRVDTEACPGRLAAAFQVTAGAMTNTLKRLEAKQFIEVVPDSTSGRKKKVTITTKGMEARELAVASVSPLFKEFASVFSSAKIKKQVKELQKIRQYLDERRFLPENR